MNETLHSISAIERDTGLSREVLRKWELRYGFPQPVRAAQGERLYPDEQLQRLRLIRRLIDQGRRPGSLLRLDSAALEALLAELATAAPATLPPAVGDEVLALLTAHDAAGLTVLLNRTLTRCGLQRFVTDFIAPLNVLIGEAWLSGAIEVAEEHLYTEQLQNVLRAALSGPALGAGSPRVLLTTFPDELHSLGLLMAEALLSTEGAACTSLGTQTPVEDIIRLASSGRVDIVALSFSGAYPLRRAVEGIQRLRTALPEAVALWCGGAGLQGRRPEIEGVRQLDTIADCLTALADWRARAAED
ncbi:MAG: MerR family transcriptional regulator [Rhodocyclaceae bacterium]|nr:MerR family transcriptional regulator [Rhodocyclaceae bacterium]